MCTDPRQKCANPLLQAPTQVGQKSVTGNMLNEFNDLTVKAVCASAPGTPERLFMGRAVSLCTTGLRRRPHHALLAILYRLCQVPVGEPRGYHAPMLKVSE